MTQPRRLPSRYQASARAVNRLALVMDLLTEGDTGAGALLASMPGSAARPVANSVTVPK